MLKSSALLFVAFALIAFGGLYAGECEPKSPYELLGGLETHCCDVDLDGFSVEVIEPDPCGCYFNLSGTLDFDEGAVSVEAFAHAFGVTGSLGSLGDGPFDYNVGTSAGCANGGPDVRVCASVTVTCDEAACRLFRICMDCVFCAGGH